MSELLPRIQQAAGIVSSHEVVLESERREMIKRRSELSGRVHRGKANRISTNHIMCFTGSGGQPRARIVAVQGLQMLRLGMKVSYETH